MARFLVPKPDVAFFCFASVAILMRRRSEHTEEELVATYSAATNLFRAVDNISIDGGLPFEDIKKLVIEVTKTIV